MRHVVQARRVGRAADDAGDAELELAGGGGNDAAHRQGALSDLAPRGQLAPRVRPLLLELLDRGERFLAHARGVDGLRRLDYVVEDLRRFFRLAWGGALADGKQLLVAQRLSGRRELCRGAGREAVDVMRVV